MVGGGAGAGGGGREEIQGRPRWPQPGRRVRVRGIVTSLVCGSAGTGGRLYRAGWPGLPGASWHILSWGTGNITTAEHAKNKHGFITLVANNNPQTWMF